MENIDHHRKYMLQALTMSTEGIGRVSPNPAVGCVIVNNGNVLAEGYHHVNGGVHAEVDALSKLNKIPPGSTLYVTVEPCNIYGKTPPCTRRILDSGIKTVITGMKDPNPAVNGSGIAMLKSKGVRVISMIMEKDIQFQNRGFTKWVREGIPWVMVKIAESSDGFISANGNERTMITGKEAQMITHKLRASCDGILIGKNTALTDNPELTVRVTNGKNPVRFIADTRDSLPRSLKIFRDQQSETVILTSDRFSEPNRTSYCTCLTVEENDGELSFHDMLEKIGGSGVTMLMIEGGAKLVSGFLSKDLVDEFYLFTAPDKLIESGLPNPFRENEKWKMIMEQRAGKDIVKQFVKKV